MSLRVLSVALCLFLVGALAAQTPRPTTPKETKSKTGAEAKAKAKAPAPPPKEAATVAGIELARPDGTFLGLSLEAGKFKLAFYDKEKKPAKAEAIRAIARWPNPHGPGQNRAVLNPAGDGTFLLAPQFVRGPYSFKLFITVVLSEDGERTENYTVDFRG